VGGISYGKGEDKYRKLKHTANKVLSLRDNACLSVFLAPPRLSHPLVVIASLRSNRRTKCKLGEANPEDNGWEQQSMCGLLRKLAMTTSEWCRLIVPQGLHFINRMLQLTDKTRADKITTPHTIKFLIPNTLIFLITYTLFIFLKPLPLSTIVPAPFPTGFTDKMAAADSILADVWSFFAPLLAAIHKQPSTRPPIGQTTKNPMKKVYP
jgi:hypothetical protein